MAVYPGSRYIQGQVIALPDKDGVQQLSVYRSIVPQYQLRETVVLRQGTRLDQIADIVYGDGSLWWVIADGNSVPPDFYDDLPAGINLRIPDAPPSS